MSLFSSIRISNHKETAARATAVVGMAVAAGSVALVTLYLSRRNQQATRRAELECSCGKVKAEIYQPAANYKYAETANMQCACNDCMNYNKAVLKEGLADETFQKKFFDPAIPYINFYDSEIRVMAGKEQLEHMKLSPRTENRRVFAKCCGTPIAISPDHSHLNLIYSNLLQPKSAMDCTEGEIPFPPEILYGATICLHADNLGSSDIQQAQTKHPQMKIVQHAFAPIEIWKIISRLGLLIGLGARGPGDGFPVGPGKTIGIGYESIPQQMK